MTKYKTIFSTMRHFSIFLFVVLLFSACKKEETMIEEEEIDPCAEVQIKGMPTVLWEQDISGYPSHNFIYSIAPIKYGETYIVTRTGRIPQTILLLDGETGEIIWEKELENDFRIFPIASETHIEGDKLYWNSRHNIAEMDLITLEERNIVSLPHQLSPMSFIDYPNYIFTAGENDFTTDVIVQHLKIVNLETEEISTIYTDTLPNAPLSFSGNELFSYPILWETNGESLVSFLKLDADEYPYNNYYFMTINVNTQEVITEQPITEEMINSIDYYPVNEDFILYFNNKTVSVDGMTGSKNWESIPAHISMQTPISPLHQVGDQILADGFYRLQFINTENGVAAASFFRADIFLQLTNAISLPNPDEIIILYYGGIALLNTQTGCTQMEFDGAESIDGAFDHLVFFYDVDKKRLLFGKGANIYCVDMDSF